jgi:hypothetical protein
MPITVNEARTRVTVSAVNPEFWKEGETIVIPQNNADREYVIVAKRYRLVEAQQGQGAQAVQGAQVTSPLEIDLRDAEFWIDKLARRYPNAAGFLPVVLALLILAPLLVAGGFYFLTTTDTKLALLGWLAAQTHYIIFFTCMLGAQLLALSLERRVGGVLSLALGMAGVVLGFILAVAWREAFIRDASPAAWPDDYVRLASNFIHDANAWWAVFSVYIPTLVVVFKVFSLKTWADVASSIKGAT